MDLSLDEIVSARDRIAGHVRKTPVIGWDAPEVAASVTLKLEFLQVGGSFKARGASASRRRTEYLLFTGGWGPRGRSRRRRAQ